MVREGTPALQIRTLPPEHGIRKFRGKVVLNKPILDIPKVEITVEYLSI